MKSLICWRTTPVYTSPLHISHFIMEAAVLQLLLFCGNVLDFFLLLLQQRHTRTKRCWCNALMAKQIKERQLSLCSWRVLSLADSICSLRNKVIHNIQSVRLLSNVVQQKELVFVAASPKKKTHPFVPLVFPWFIFPPLVFAHLYLTCWCWEKKPLPSPSPVVLSQLHTRPNTLTWWLASIASGIYQGYHYY